MCVELRRHARSGRRVAGCCRLELYRVLLGKVTVTRFEVGLTFPAGSTARTQKVDVLRFSQTASEVEVVVATNRLLRKTLYVTLPPSSRLGSHESMALCFLTFALRL